MYDRGAFGGLLKFSNEYCFGAGDCDVASSACPFATKSKDSANTLAAIFLIVAAKESFVVASAAAY
jgi:hypothetical protein